MKMRFAAPVASAATAIMLLGADDLRVRDRPVGAKPAHRRLRTRRTASHPRESRS